MNLLSFIISSLATYRLTRLIIAEEGPFSLMQRLRESADEDAWIGRGLACPWCLSFWLGPLCAALTHHKAGRVVVEGLAVSSVVGLAMTYGAAVFNRLMVTRGR